MGTDDQGHRYEESVQSREREREREEGRRKIAIDSEKL